MHSSIHETLEQAKGILTTEDEDDMDTTGNHSLLIRDLQYHIIYRISKLLDAAR